MKLDAKSLKCVLLGVSEESKAYRLFNPISNKIIVSRDVVFEEDQQWCWDDTHKQNILTDLEWEANEVGEQLEDKNCTEGFGADAEPREIINSTKEPELNAEQPGDAEQPEDVDESHNAEQPGDADESHTSNSNILSSHGRTRRPPVWMQDYASGQYFSDEETANMTLLALLSDSDPMTFEEAVKSEKWRQAMDQEMQAIERNDTWELTVLPSGSKTIGVKWVFKTKVNENGEVDKYKARLVAKGYCQQYGIDYAEVFAPVARLDTI
jgi:hypothetical protein